MLEPEAIINDNIFDVINDLSALWKTRRYDRTEKKDFTCFSCLVSMLFWRTKVQGGIWTFIEIIVKYFANRAYCLCSIQYAYIIMLVQAATETFQVISNNLISSDSLINPKNFTAIWCFLQSLEIGLKVVGPKRLCSRLNYVHKEV